MAEVFIRAWEDCDKMLALELGDHAVIRKKDKLRENLGRRGFRKFLCRVYGMEEIQALREEAYRFRKVKPVDIRRHKGYIINSAATLDADSRRWSVVITISAIIGRTITATCFDHLETFPDKTNAVTAGLIAGQQLIDDNHPGLPPFQ